MILGLWEGAGSAAGGGAGFGGLGKEETQHSFSLGMNLGLRAELLRP